MLRMLLYLASMVACAVVNPAITLCRLAKCTVACYQRLSALCKRAHCSRICLDVEFAVVLGKYGGLRSGQSSNHILQTGMLRAGLWCTVYNYTSLGLDTL